MLTKGQKSPALARADAAGEFLSHSSVTETLPCHDFASLRLVLTK